MEPARLYNKWRLPDAPVEICTLCVRIEYKAKRAHLLIMTSCPANLIEGQSNDVVLAALRYAARKQDERGERGGVAGSELTVRIRMGRNTLEAMVAAGLLERTPGRGFDILYRVTKRGRTLLAS